MRIRKGILIILLISAMLFLLLPSPAMADDTWTGVLLILLGLIVIGGIIAVAVGGGMGFLDNTFDIGSVEVILDIQGNPVLINKSSPFQNLQGHSDNRVDYNIDWLITGRDDGRLWVGAGLTINSPQMFTGSELADNEYGGNLMFGYNEGPWDQKWLITYLANGEFKANAEIYYRF